MARLIVHFYKKFSSGKIRNGFRLLGWEGCYMSHERKKIKRKQKIKLELRPYRLGTFQLQTSNSYLSLYQPLNFNNP